VTPTPLFRTWPHRPGRQNPRETRSRIAARAAVPSSVSQFSRTSAVPSTPISLHTPPLTGFPLPRERQKRVQRHVSAEGLVVDSPQDEGCPPISFLLPPRSKIRLRRSGGSKGVDQRSMGPIRSGTGRPLKAFLEPLTKYHNIVIITRMAWEIEYFETGKGRCPVQEFIDTLDTRSKAKIARTLDLLEEFGIKLGMPYASM
jgi:hypothetical protein